MVNLRHLHLHLKGNNLIPIDLSGLDNGLYFIPLEKGKEAITGKIIKN